MEELKEIRKRFGLSQKDMANILGIKQNSYSYIENGKVSMTDRNKSILAEKLSININWLNGASDEPMIKHVEGLENVSDDAIVNEVIAHYSTHKSDYDGIDLAPVIDHLIHKKETRPRIPYTAAAGSLTSAVEGITSDQCEQIPRINIFPEYDFTIIIKGDSMEPKYEGGDEVACKRIDSTSFIQWGKPHVLDTAQGILIKRVYDDGGKIRCVSYNSEYPDFSINKEEIYSMSLVVGLVRL